MKLVLDTNCIIDLEEHGASYYHLIQILSKWRAKDIELGVVAIIASERQKAGHSNESFGEFELRLASVGLTGVEILYPMAYWDIAYMNHALYCDKEMEALEVRIHNVLFPNAPFESPQHDEHEKGKWLNSKCDVQVVWALVFHEWEVLVTSDRNFHRKARELQQLGVKNVLLPSKAANLGMP